jgi:hypothetical protein
LHGCQVCGVSRPHPVCSGNVAVGRYVQASLELAVTVQVDGVG